jgi:DNA helicase-2/ATP-dependent DNA helicase PcrA
LYFEEKFPHTKIIALRDNYRSVQRILDLAHTLITEVDSPAADLRVPLQSISDQEGEIDTRVYTHESVENEAIVTKVRALLSVSVPAEEIAIIVRSNREVEQFAALLRDHGVPVFPSADGDILVHPITTSIRTLLKAALEVHNQEALCTVLHAPYVGINTNDLVKVLQARSFERNLRSIISDSTYLETLALLDSAPFIKLVSTLESVRSMMITEAPQRVLQFLLQSSGLLDHIITKDSIESGRVVRRLYDEVESLVVANQVATLAEVSTFLDTYVAYGLAINAPYIHSTAQAVRVMTAHKSKGLEFSHVFIPHLTDSRWGDRTRPTYFDIPVVKMEINGAFDELDDERKLLYVACTRAKEGLYLSSASESIEGRLLGKTSLLTEEVLAHTTMIITKEEEESFNPVTVLSLVPPVKVPFDIDLIRRTLTERGLSATALNNYLRSPWNYLYRNVLRVPELKEESALFGTVLHSVLRRATHQAALGEGLPSPTLIKTYLEQDLGRLPLTTVEFTRLHARGLAALTLYLETVGPALPKVMQEEVAFTAKLPTGDFDLPEVLLTGNLDRLDFASDGTLEKVLDYKSGKPKTRGYIEGTIKDGTGDYKRQLTFYALLLSLQPDSRFHTKQGVLSFVEPDEKGKIHEEAFTITDEEISALKKEIVTVALAIYRGEFLLSVCDPARSEYCDLVASLQS